MKLNLKIIKISSLILIILFSICAVAKKEESKDIIVIPESLLNQVEKGNAEIAYFIANMHKNTNKYMEWLEKAANMDYPQAILDLAGLLALDDEEEALVLYHKAAKLGMGKALYQIGNFYYAGKASLEANCLIAYEWYEKAELKEYKDAYNNHAWYLATSFEKKCRNPEKAVKTIYQLIALYEVGIDIIPWRVWDTQAAVLASISDFSKAIELQKWLIEKMYDNDLDINNYKHRLNIYKKRQAFSQMFKNVKGLSEDQFWKQ